MHRSKSWELAGMYVCAGTRIQRSRGPDESDVDLGAQVARPLRPGCGCLFQGILGVLHTPLRVLRWQQSLSSTTSVFQSCFTAADPLKDLRHAPLKKLGACWGCILLTLTTHGPGLMLKHLKSLPAKTRSADWNDAVARSRSQASKEDGCK